MKPMPHQIIDATMADRELASVLAQIAELAGVPLENRPPLIASLTMSVAQTRCHAYRVGLFGASKINKSAKRIARAAAELANAMSDEGALEFIRFGIPQSRPQSLADYRELTARLAAAAKQASASRGGDPWRDRNRAAVECQD
jgi:hypothetical protein